MKVNKPKLVDERLIEKIIKAQEESKPFNYNIIGAIVYNFLLNNIFVVSIFTFIGILLLYRYYHVQSKKKVVVDSTEVSSEKETESS